MTDVDPGIKRIERELALLSTDVDPPAGSEARVLLAIGDERIERELTQLGTEANPPADWEARVLAATGSKQSEPAMTQPAADLPAPGDPKARTRREQRPRRSVRAGADTAERQRRPWWHFAAPAFAIAGLVIVYCLRPQPLTLDVQIVQLQPTMLGSSGTTSTAVGNVARVTADGGDPHRAVWIYRDNRVLVVCPGEPRCQKTGTALQVDVVLDTIAVYRFVALTSKSPIPLPQGHYDDDLAAARRAGSVHEIRSITAR